MRKQRETTKKISNKSDITTLGTFQAAQLSPSLDEALTPCSDCGKVIPKEDAETDKEGKKYCADCWQKRTGVSTPIIP